MCSREELEGHFEAAKQYARMRREIAALRNQGVSRGDVYRQVVSSSNNPLILRYYAPSLYAHAMTVAVEPVQPQQEETQEIPQPQEALPEQETTLHVVEPSEPGILPVEEETPATLETATQEQKETSPTLEQVGEKAAIVSLPFPALDTQVSPFVVIGRNTQTGEDVAIFEEEMGMGLHALGGNGTRKTTMISGMFLGDTHNGGGGMSVDPDGDSTNEVLSRIPEERMQDVLLLDLAELAKMGRYIGINPLSILRNGTDLDAAIDRYMHVFMMLFNISSKDTPRLVNTLRASLLTLGVNNLTLSEMPLLLRDKKFRKRCIEAIPVTYETEGVRSFWKDTFDELYVQEQLKYSDSTMNKILQFMMATKVLYAVSQGKTTIDFRQIMDEGKIVLLKLSAQDIGETAARFLGAFLLAELKNALFSRADVPVADRPYFSLYADEWYLYLTADFRDILTRGRKYRMKAAVVNQTLSQLDEVDRAVGLNKALRGITEQVNIHVTFAVNEEDAAILSPYYALDPEPMQPRFVETPVGNVIDEICSGKRHPNEIVNTFCMRFADIVRDAHMAPKEREHDTIERRSNGRRGVVIYRQGRYSGTEERVALARKVLTDWNTFFYHVMQGNIIPFSEAFLYTAKLFDLPFIAHESLLLHEPPPLDYRIAKDVPIDITDTSAFEQALRERLTAHFRTKMGVDTDIEMNVNAVFARMHPAFLAFVSEVQEVAQALAQQPMFRSSGVAANMKEIQLPTNTPFTWLVSGHTHRNPLVTQFVDSTLRTIDAATKDEYARDFRAEFNSFLYRAMTGQPLTLLCNSFPFLLRVHGYYPFGTFYFAHTLVDVPDLVMRPYAIDSLFTYPEKRGRYTALRTGKTTETIGDIPTLHVDLPSHAPLDEQAVAALLHLLQENDGEPFAAYAEQKLQRRIDAYLTAYEQVYPRFEKFLAITPSETSLFYSSFMSSPYRYLPPAQEREKWEKHMRYVLTEERKQCETFLKAFRDFLLGLSADPPLVGSGHYEVVQTGQRTYADMEKEKAKELLGLPNGTAYVAIRSRGDGWKVRMETKHLDEMFPIVGSVEQRRLQALNNALPYTTEAQEIRQEVQTRRLAFGIEPYPEPQQQPQQETQQEIVTDALPVTEETQEREAPPTLPTKAHAVITTAQEGTPDTYLELLYYFSNLTLKQLVRLAGLQGVTKEEQQKINKREQSKINRLIGSGLVETVEPDATKFLVTGGRAPKVYRLKKAGYDKLKKEKGYKPIHQGDFSPHAYKVNEVVIALLQGLKETSYTLVDFTHEKQFRQKPIAVGNQGLEPDSWLCCSVNGTLQSVYVEVDLKSESLGKLKEKIRRYLQAIEKKAHQGFTAEKITVAFLNPNGKDTDTDRLVRIIQETLDESGKTEYAAVFLVASITIEEIQPLELLTAALYKRPFDTAAYPLIQQYQ